MRVTSLRNFKIYEQYGIWNILEEQQKYINEMGLENSDSLFNKKSSYIRGTLRLLQYKVKV